MTIKEHLLVRHRNDPGLSGIFTQDEFEKWLEIKYEPALHSETELRMAATIIGMHGLLSETGMLSDYRKQKRAENRGVH